MSSQTNDQSVAPQFALMTVALGKRSPTIALAAELLGVPVAAVDSSYGLVPIDPEQGLFAVRVKSDALANPSFQEGQLVRGPYADVKIAPFGGRRGTTIARSGT